MRTWIFIVAALVLSGLSGCRQKQLDYGDEDFVAVDVMFDWVEAPEASPEGMTLYFFPLTEAGKIWRFDISGREGGRVILPAGEYSLLAYNNDLAGVRVTTSLRQDGFRASLPADSRPIEPLYSGDIGSVSISPKGLQTIICTPRKISTTYTVKILHLNGPTAITSASLSLKGVAESLGLLTGLPGDAACSVGAPFGSTQAPMEARFESFRAPGELLLDITVTAASGRRFTKEFDVTAQLANNPNALNVLILIDTLDLPAEDSPGDEGPDVGIGVDVDGWVENVINYETKI